MGVQNSEFRVEVISFTYNPASIATITTAEQTVTVPGLKVGDIVVLQKPTHTTGVGIVNVRVSAVDTLSVTWVNPTAGAVDPASETYLALVFRPERVQVSAFNP